MRKLAIGELVLDFTLYPRHQVDPQHVAYMREAYRAGSTFPPQVIDKASRRITDGFHRQKVYLAEESPDFKVEVVEKPYTDEKTMLLDAMRYNASHGRTLTRFDRTHCLLLGEKLGLTVAEVAGALSLTVDAAAKLRTDRVGKLWVAGAGKHGKAESRPLKNTIAHMAGKTLSPAQSQANERLSGMNQVFYVNQLITLIEADLIDKENEKLLSALQKLCELLEGVLETA